MIRNCIDPTKAAELKAAITKDDLIDVDELKKIGSKGRNELFSKYIDKDLAVELNIGFEKRIYSETEDLLSDYITRELKHVPKKVKANLTERLMTFGKMENVLDGEGNVIGKKLEKSFLDPNDGDAFLDELVAHKIGAHIEPETAERLLKFAEKAQTLRADIAKVIEDIAGGNVDKLEKLNSVKVVYGTRGNIKPIKGYNIDDLNRLSEARLAFGRADYDVKSYIESVIKEKAKGVPLPDGVVPKIDYFATGSLKAVGSVTKAINATFDNSLFGRQGWKTLLMEPGAWGPNFVKSWVDIPKTWGDLKESRRLIDTEGKPTEFFYENVMRETHAEIVSRPNSLRGAYRAAANEYGINVTGEELFPQLFEYAGGTKREKIFGNVVVNVPVRIHKGFENAFSAGALRMRADLADAMIARVERNGLNAMDKNIANALGTFVSSVTGRGELGRLSVIGNELGTVLFSPRFFKSQIDTILQPYELAARKGSFANIPKEVRNEILLKYARYGASNVGLLAAMHGAGLTDLDPRSDAFGYLVIGDRKYDMTGGARGFLAFMSRLYTSERKNFTTGAISDREDMFGYSKSDEIGAFIEGKMSPLTSASFKIFFGDGTNFSGYDIDPRNGLDSTKNLIKDLMIPITLNQWSSMVSSEEPSLIQGMMAEFVGIGNSVQVNRPGYGKWSELLNADKDQYEKAVKEYNDELWKIVRKGRNSSTVKKMSEEEMSEYYQKEISAMKRDILEDYKKYLPEED